MGIYVNDDSTFLQKYTGLTDKQRVHAHTVELFQNVVDSVLQSVAKLYPHAQKGVSTYTSLGGLINVGLRVKVLPDTHVVILHENGHEENVFASFHVVEGHTIVVVQPDVITLYEEDHEEQTMTCIPIMDMFLVGRSTKKNRHRDDLPLGGSFGLGLKQFSAGAAFYKYDFMMLHKENLSDKIVEYKPFIEKKELHLYINSNRDYESWRDEYINLIGNEYTPQTMSGFIISRMTFPDTSENSLWAVLCSSHVLLSLDTTRFLDSVRLHTTKNVDESYCVMSSRPNSMIFLNGVPFTFYPCGSKAANLMLVTTDISGHENPYRDARNIDNVISGFNSVDIDIEHLKEAFSNQTSEWATLLYRYHKYGYSSKEKLIDWISSSGKHVIVEDEWNQLPRGIKDEVRDRVLLIRRNQFNDWLYASEDDDGYQEPRYPSTTFTVLNLLKKGRLETYFDHFPLLREFCEKVETIGRFMTRYSDPKGIKYLEAVEVLKATPVYDSRQHFGWKPQSWNCIVDGTLLLHVKGDEHVNIEKSIIHTLYNISDFDKDYIIRCIKRQILPDAHLLLDKPFTDDSFNNTESLLSSIGNHVDKACQLLSKNRK